jgi:hypothetical protein
MLGSRNTRSLCAGNACSLRDGAVIDPSGHRYEPCDFHGFVRDDGGGGNRTRVHAHWLCLAQGSEPFRGIVTPLVRGLCASVGTAPVFRFYRRASGEPA